MRAIICRSSSFVVFRRVRLEKRLDGEYHFRPPDEMRATFGAEPELLAHSRELADRCSFTFSFGKPQFPGYTPPDGFTPASIEAGRAMRAKLLSLNPNIILLAEIRYRDASKDYLPQGHQWWMRNADGTVVSGWAEGGYMRLDLHNPDFVKQVARQARAAASRTSSREARP